MFKKKRSFVTAQQIRFIGAFLYGHNFLQTHCCSF